MELPGNWQSPMEKVDAEVTHHVRCAPVPGIHLGGHDPLPGWWSPPQVYWQLWVEAVDEVERHEGVVHAELAVLWQLAAATIAVDRSSCVISSAPGMTR